MSADPATLPPLVPAEDAPPEWPEDARKRWCAKLVAAGYVPQPWRWARLERERDRG